MTKFIINCNRLTSTLILNFHCTYYAINMIGKHNSKLKLKGSAQNSPSSFSMCLLTKV